MLNKLLFSFSSFLLLLNKDLNVKLLLLLFPKRLPPTFLFCLSGELSSLSLLSVFQKRLTFSEPNNGFASNNPVPEPNKE